MTDRKKEGPPLTDRLLITIDAVREAERSVQIALHEAAQTFEKARMARLEGKPLPELAGRALAREGLDTRRQVAAAIADYEHAVMIFRATVIRELVDDHEMSFTEVGRRLGISRQMVARLYRSRGRKPYIQE